MRYWSECRSMCAACPFNTTDEAANASNLGCLPTSTEIFALKDAHDVNWGCHQGGEKLCAGFVAVAKDNSVDYKSGVLLDTPHYLSTGEIRAIDVPVAEQRAIF